MTACKIVPLACELWSFGVERAIIAAQQKRQQKKPAAIPRRVKKSQAWITIWPG